ncbi:hypothetical protein H257_09471 [Aphanomyces astaci]|uniref:Amino acid transporter n=2 Tax=Aphanomyces astaci TaxID=112090 RepID=W4G9S7_APHAT|nr:hypothetical protein H257_09471 [Aphanomyces astaci]ETV76452.1 hypothetical protein H257_09471 [Aphanomyces astaci]|eukprot:XP_009833997.1 hypothetical protein H257_09471 [Aphanomyces astaci]
MAVRHINMAHRQQQPPIVLYDPEAIEQRSYSPTTIRSNESPQPYPCGHHHTAQTLDVDFRVAATAPSFAGARRRRLPGLSGIQGPKSPSMRILLGSLLGLVLGILLSFLYESLNKPPWMASVSKWIQQPGHLFIRALNCAIIPMVLANTAASVADAVLSGRVRQLLGWRTMGLFFLSSVCSGIAGAVAVLLFQAALIPSAMPIPAKSQKVLGSVVFGCGNATARAINDSTLFAWAGNMSFCSFVSTSAAAASLVTLETPVNSSDYFVLNKPVLQSRSLTDHVMVVVEQLVTDNILDAMAKGNLLSVIMVAIPIGIATAAAANALPHSPLGHSLDEFLRCVRDAFFLLLGWVVDLTPFAMVSIIASAILDSTMMSARIDVESSQLSSFFQDAVKLVVPLALAASTHMFVVLPVMFYLFVHANPFAYMKAMAPVYVFAAGASSSMATLPIAISTMIATKQVPKIVPEFVFPIATVVNMNASGIYMAMHVAFIAYIENYVLNVAEIAILLLVSLLSSVGTPPIPNGGLIMILTIWNTVLQRPHDVLPPAFKVVVACDYLTDRIATLLNVHGNVIITRIIAEDVDATVLETRQPSRHQEEDGDSSTD